MKRMFIKFLFIISSFTFSVLGFPLSTFGNTLPQITDSGYEPQVAEPGQEIFFWLYYKDPDGNPPTYVRIYLFDGLHEMEKVGENPDLGTKYQYRRVATAAEGGIEYYFEANDGENTIRFPNYEGGAALAEVLTEPQNNNKIYLFSRESKTPLWSYDTGKDWVQKVALSDDGSLIVAKTSDFIYLFQRESATPIWNYKCNTELDKNNASFAGWIDISDDGNYIAGGCQDSFHLFSKESNNPLWSYPDYIYTVSLSSHGDNIAVGTYGGETGKGDEVILFSKESSNPIWTYQAASNVHGLAISADGNYIAAGSHCPDRRALLFSRESNKPIISFVASEHSPVWSATISANGQRAVYGLEGGGNFSNIFIFSPEQKEPIQNYKIGDWMRSIDISLDGEYIVAGSADKNIYLFDLDIPEPLWQYQTQEKVGTVAISKANNYIVAGSRDKNVYLIPREKGEPQWDYQTSGWVNTVDISANEEYLAAGTGAQQYLGESNATLGNGNNIGNENNDEITKSVSSEPIENKTDYKAISFYILLGVIVILGSLAIVMMVKKKNKIAIILIIITLVVGIVGYLFYSQILKIQIPFQPKNDQQETEEKVNVNCGDGICHDQKGETYKNCPQDCGALK